MSVTVSGPAAGRASGTAPGQIGTWTCPGDGCHVDVCARSAPSGTSRQSATHREHRADPCCARGQRVIPSERSESRDLHLTSLHSRVRELEVRSPRTTVLRQLSHAVQRVAVDGHRHRVALQEARRVPPPVA